MKKPIQIIHHGAVKLSSPLPADQIRRIVRVNEIIGEAITLTLDHLIQYFKMQGSDTEDELCTWKAMATAYRSFVTIDGYTH
jgi:hypothetical protein